MGVIPLKKNQWTAIKILFQTSLSPLGVYSYMKVTKSVQDGIVGSTDGLSLNLSEDAWEADGRNWYCCEIVELFVPSFAGFVQRWRKDTRCHKWSFYWRVENQFEPFNNWDRERKGKTICYTTSYYTKESEYSVIKALCPQLSHLLTFGMVGTRRASKHGEAKPIND